MCLPCRLVDASYPQVTPFGLQFLLDRSVNSDHLTKSETFLTINFQAHDNSTAFLCVLLPKRVKKDGESLHTLDELLLVELDLLLVLGFALLHHNLYEDLIEPGHKICDFFLGRSVACISLRFRIRIDHFADDVSEINLLVPTLIKLHNFSRGLVHLDKVIIGEALETLVTVIIHKYSRDKIRHVFLGFKGDAVSTGRFVLLSDVANGQKDEGGGEENTGVDDRLHIFFKEPFG